MAYRNSYIAAKSTSDGCSPNPTIQAGGFIDPIFFIGLSEPRSLTPLIFWGIKFLFQETPKLVGPLLPQS